MRCTYCFCLVLIVLGGFLTGCDRTESDWLKARQANTIQAYNEFLAKHPEGQRVKEAKSAIEELDWANARQANTEESYRAFLDQRKESRFAPEALEQLASLRFDPVIKTKSLVAYREYAHEFVGTAPGKQMQDLLDKIGKALELLEQTQQNVTSVHINASPSRGSSFIVLGDQNRMLFPPSAKLDLSVSFMFQNKQEVKSFSASSPVQRNANSWVFRTDEAYAIFYSPQSNLTLPEFPDNFSSEAEIIEIADRLPDQLTSKDFYRLWRILVFRDIDKELKAKNPNAGIDTLGMIRKLQSGS